MIKLTFLWGRSADATADEAEALADRVLAEEVRLPGLRRLASWRVREAPQPADVKRDLNSYHRLTETWWDDEATCLERHAPLLQDALAESAVVGRHFALLSAATPEFDLLKDAPPQHYPYASLPVDWSRGHRPRAPEPDGHDLWRYVYFFNYRPEVPLEDGEDWYLGHHTREGKQLPGLVHYVTWRRLGPPTGAGGWADEARRFVRYTELCFEDFDTWHLVCYREGPRWHMSEEHGGVWGDYEQLFLGPRPDVLFSPGER